MRLKACWFITVLLAAMSISFLPTGHTLADVTELLYWDFRTSQHGATVIPWDLATYTNPVNDGTWDTGLGFGTSTTVDYEPGYTGQFLEVRLPDDAILNNCAITSFAVYYNGGFTGISGHTSVGAAAGGSRGEYYSYFEDGTDWRNAILFITYLGTSHSYITGIAVQYDPADTCLGGGLGDLTRPLKSADLHPEWGMYDPAYAASIDTGWPDDGSIEPVFAFSNGLDAGVHSVKAGTVKAVDASVPCYRMPPSSSCYIIIPKEIAGTPKPVAWFVEMTGLTAVIVEPDDDPSATFTYYVSSPNVAIGDHVSAGCVLGKTIELKAPGFSDGGADPSLQLGGGTSGIISVQGGSESDNDQYGVTIVRYNKLEPETTRLYPSLTLEPDESSCALNNFNGCVNPNSSLLTFENWIHTDGVTLIDGGGAVLPSGSQIYQTGLMLDEGTSYTINVQARSTEAGDGFSVVPKIRIFAGSGTSDQPITTTWVNYSYTFSGADLTPEQAFGVVNQNFTGTDIEIRYVCMSEEGTGTVSSGCYFKNHHFDDGPTFWTITDGITFNAGQAYTYNDSVIEQGAMLNPIDGSTPADYTLKVVGRLIATNAYTGQIGKSVTIQYRYPTGGTYTDVGTVDSSLVDAEGKRVLDGSVNLEHAYTLTATVSISTPSTGLFSFKTVVDDSDSYLKGFRIDYICLQSPVDGFPGQGGSGFDPPFYENCQVVAIPEDNNINSWVYYHWSNLDRFFNCTLMVTLNKMAKTLDDAWKTTRLFMRWIVATSQASGRWLSIQFFPWFNGHLRNIAIGQVTTVYSTSGTCSDLFCVLNTLVNGLITPLQQIVSTLVGLVNNAASLFLTILTGVVGVGLSFLIRIFNLFSQASSLLTGLIAAYTTAAPITIDGMPMCSVDPASSPFCRAVWVLDNTILGGRWAVLITLIIAIATIHLILWSVGEFKRSIVGTAGGAA